MLVGTLLKRSGTEDVFVPEEEEQKKVKYNVIALRGKDWASLQHKTGVTAYALSIGYRPSVRARMNE